MSSYVGACGMFGTVIGLVCGPAVVSEDGKATRAAPKGCTSLLHYHMFYSRIAGGIIMGCHGNGDPCQTEFCLAKRLRYWATSPWREDWLQVLWLNILALLVSISFLPIFPSFLLSFWDIKYLQIAMWHKLCHL